VAILTTAKLDGDSIDFDPWDALDRSTLRLGPSMAAPLGEPSAVDVDADGDIDMLFNFKTGQTGVTCSLTQLGIKAKTYDAESVIGADTIVTTGCH